jgi:hypothetical protein
MFRMGPKVTDDPAVDGTTTAIPSGEVLEAVEKEDNAEAVPELPPAVVEQHKRQADLERLNNMSETVAGEIDSMDMMGEYGSKVGSFQAQCAVVRERADTRL